MKKSLSYLSLAVFIAVFFFGALVSTNQASAQSVSLCQMVDSLISAGLILPSNASAAKIAVGCPTPVVSSASTTYATFVSQSLNVNSIGNNNDIGVGSFKFKVTAVSDDVLIYISQKDSSLDVMKNGLKVGSPKSADLTSTADIQGDYFLVQEGNSETFTLTYVIEPVQGSGYYQTVANSIFWKTSSNAGDLRLGFTSNQVYLNSNTPFIKITSPNGGEQYSTGSNYEVKFSSNNVNGGQMTLELVNKAGASPVKAIVSCKADVCNGSIPKNTPAGSYTVKLTANTLSGSPKIVSDTSDGVIKIVVPEETPKCGTQFNRDLIVGSSGDDVTALQTRLGITPATGYFGANTKAAVQAYQVKNGLPATGFVDVATRAMMNARSCVETPVIVVPPATSTKPSITITDPQGNKEITIKNDGRSFTLTGKPQGLGGFEYWQGQGLPNGNFYSRAFFFDDSIFTCINNEASTNKEWTITCTPKKYVSGASNIYVEIYKDERVYRSNNVLVNIFEGAIPITPSITVLSPNGGEKWVKGSTQTIKWNANFPKSCNDQRLCGNSNKMETYSIFLEEGVECPDGAQCIRGMNSKSIANSVTDTKYDLNISDMFINSPYYKIKVCINSNKLCDKSDSYFSIVPNSTNPSTSTKPSITVVYPNGGEVFTVGSKVKIDVKTTLKDNQTKGITLQLYKLNSSSEKEFVRTIVSEWNGGFPQTVTIPANLQDGEYYLYATALAPKLGLPEGGVSDFSDSSFKIVSATSTQPSIKVLSPNGGEKYTIGSIETIKWDVKLPSQGCTTGDNCPEILPPVANIKLVPSCDNTICTTVYTNYVIAENIPYSVTWSSYNWYVGKYADDSGSGRMAPAGIYKVKICAGGVCDTSDSSFKIVSATSTTQPSIKVLSPNGGEKYTNGTFMNIKFSVVNPSNLPIILALYRNPNDVGDKLELVKYINSNVAQDSGSFIWTIPRDVPSYSGYKIQAAITAPNDLNSNSVVDYSDSYFSIISNSTNATSTIFTCPADCLCSGNNVACPDPVENPQPSIKVLSPNGKEIINAGGDYLIKYTSTNVNESQMTLDLINTNGASAIKVNIAGADGKYLVKIPATIPVGAYKIKLTAKSTDGVKTVSDVSDNFFWLAKPKATATTSVTSQPGTAMLGWENLADLIQALR